MAEEPTPQTIEVAMYGKADSTSADQYQELMAAAAPKFATINGMLDAAAYFDEASGRSCDIIWWNSRGAWQAGPEQAMQIPEIAAFFAALDEATTAVQCYQRALPVLVQAQPTPAHVLEIAQYRLADGSDPAIFLQHCQKIRALIATWDGFLRFDTLRDPASGEWVDLVCWRDRASADAAMQRIQQEAAAAAWMQMLDPASIRMHHFNSVALPTTWR